MNIKKESLKMLIAVNLLAIAIILDVIINAIPGLNLSMPFGGKFFGISMFPLVLIGLFAGLKYGLISGFIYALYNFGIDYIIYIDSLRSLLESYTGTPWSIEMIVMLVLFDYFIPFTAYGLSGLFYDGFKSLRKMLTAIVVVSVVRLVSSTLSGVILWSSSITYAVDAVEAGTESANIATQIFAFMGNNLWLYSLTYNFLYLFTTTLVVMVLSYVSFNRLHGLSRDFL